jgi:hypothetical protein
MDFKDLVTVYTLTNPTEAEIIKNFLQSEGMHCFLEGINQAAETGLIALKIKVQVPASDSDRARKLIESHEKRQKGHG